MATSASNKPVLAAACRFGAGRACGFSLLEVLLVVVLIAAIGAVTAASLGGGLDGLRLRSASKQLVNELRHARARAIASGQVQRVEVNPAERTWAAADGRRGQWPEALDVRFTGAREVQPHAGAGAIVFFADGASSGGRIELGRGDTVLRIDIAWLTGEVRAGKGAVQ